MRETDDCLLDFADDLLALVKMPSTRADVVPLYATAILMENFAHPAAAHTRWSEVNRAIMARWSIAGLQFIKQQAWKRAELSAAALSVPPKAEAD